MAKYNKLAGKHIAVVGGTRGIGRGVVEASIESGAIVTLVGSSQNSADAAVSSIKAEYPSAQLVGLGCDLSQPTVEQDLDAVLTRAAQLNGEIDHLILTASEALPMLPIENITREFILKSAHMRLVLPVTMGKLAKKHLVGAANGNPGKGKNKSLTLTTGTLAWQPIPNSSLTSSLVAGISGLARGLALELAPIRVNTVEPGAVNTDLWDALLGTREGRDEKLQAFCSHLPVGKAAVVEEVAEAYMYLLRDTNATGETIRTDGGQHIV